MTRSLSLALLHKRVGDEVAVDGIGPEIGDGEYFALPVCRASLLCG